MVHHLKFRFGLSLTPKGSVFAVEACGAHLGFIPAYLDALMSEYLEYKGTSARWYR